MAYTVSRMWRDVAPPFFDDLRVVYGLYERANMTHAGKIPLAAAIAGENETAMMERLISEHQTIYKVAVALGVYPNAVRAWMKRNGYVSTPNGWKKQTQPELTAQSPRL